MAPTTISKKINLRNRLGIMNTMGYLIPVGKILMQHKKKVIAATISTGEILSQVITGDILMPEPPITLDPMFPIIETPIQKNNNIELIIYKNMWDNTDIQLNLNQITPEVYNLMFNLSRTEEDKTLFLSILTQSQLLSPIISPNDFNIQVIQLNTLTYLSAIFPEYKNKFEDALTTAYKNYFESLSKSNLSNNHNFILWRNNILGDISSSSTSKLKMPLMQILLDHKDYFKNLQNNLNNANTQSNTDWEKLLTQRSLEKSKEQFELLKEQLEIAKTTEKLTSMKADINNELNSIMGRCHLMMNYIIDKSIPELIALKDDAKLKLNNFKNSISRNKLIAISSGFAAIFGLGFAFYTKMLTLNSLKNILPYITGNLKSTEPQQLTLNVKIPDINKNNLLNNKTTIGGLTIGAGLGLILAKVLAKLK